MKDENFITTLFMFIVGLVFIVIAFAPIVLNIVKWIENTEIKNNGEQITATIIYNGIIDDDYYMRRDEDVSGFSNMFRSYTIEYIVNGKKYLGSIQSAEKYHNEGETIIIYCLLDNPEKIYVPIENNGRIIAMIFGFPIFFILGVSCIISYNIFTYKKQKYYFN